MRPHGLTLWELEMMAVGKMEMLGGTMGGGRVRQQPYDPVAYQRMLGIRA